MKKIILILWIILLLASCWKEEPTKVNEDIMNAISAYPWSYDENKEEITTHDWVKAFIAKKLWNHFDKSYIYILGKSWENEYAGCWGFRSPANCYFYKSDNSRLKNFAEAEYIWNINPWNIDEDFNITFLNENELHYNSWVGDGWSASVWTDTLNLVTGKISRESYGYNNNQDGETEKTWPFYDEFFLEK